MTKQDKFLKFSSKGAAAVAAQSIVGPKKTPTRKLLTRKFLARKVLQLETSLPTLTYPLHPEICFSCHTCAAGYHDYSKPYFFNLKGATLLV